MKTLTHVEKVKNQNLQIKEQVQALLGWSNHDYCHFQEAIGYHYLDSEIGLNTPLVKELTHTKEFWSWFKNQWIKRDLRFLKDVMAVANHRPKTIYRANTIVATYKNYHRSGSILFAPHKTTMRESYSRMIGNLNKRVVNG